MDHIAGRDPGIVWRVLAVLNLYRVLVPLVLLGLYFLGGAAASLFTPVNYSSAPPYFILLSVW